ncbi:hypothetical protein KUCAC02_003271, partial [Chaenocephalus aceratus]
GGQLGSLHSDLRTSTHGECIDGSLVYLRISCIVKGKGANKAMAGISSVMLPTHGQADMTKPAAALTWWVSACGGSINKHYLSSRTSNRAGPPGGTRGE